MRKVVISDLVGIEAFEGGAIHRRFITEALKVRMPVLRCLNAEEAVKVADLLGGEVVDCKLDDSTDWVLALKLFFGLEIHYLLQHGEPEFEDQLLTLYSKESLNIGIPAEDIADLTVLYANALIYAAKKIRSDLPKVSHYL